MKAMTFDSYRRLGVFICLALAAVGTAFIANAPESFPYLWQVKTATASFVGVGNLLLKLTNP